MTAIVNTTRSKPRITKDLISFVYLCVHKMLFDPKMCCLFSLLKKTCLNILKNFGGGVHKVSFGETDNKSPFLPSLEKKHEKEIESPFPIQKGD